MSTSGAEREKNKHLYYSINYKTSDNSAGSSLYESFLLVNLYNIKVSGIASGNKLIKTIRYPHM